MSQKTSPTEKSRNTRHSPLGVAGFSAAYQKLLKNKPGMIASELGGELSWLHKTRERDAKIWQELGLPTKDLERWRYSDFSLLENAKIFTPETFNSSLKKSNAEPEIFSNSKSEITDDVYELVFINGQYIAEKSRPPENQGVSILALAKTFNESVSNGWTGERLDRFSAFRKHLENSDVDTESVFASMNTSFMQDALIVLVDERAVVDRPILISHFSESHGDFSNRGGEVSSNETGDNLMMSSPRIFLHLKKGARAAVMERFLGPVGEKYFLNSVSDILVEDYGHLTHCRLQLESNAAFHIGTTRIRQMKKSTTETALFSFGGVRSRHDLHISLEGEGADTILNGISAVENDQQVDNHTVVDHMAEHTTSNQVYKNILNDKSRAVFKGHIRIRRDAQNAFAAQLNNNLLLSQHVEVDTRPELAIDADNVKATHGATVGQIDPDQVFYLQTRGVSKNAAAAMLARGFALDIAYRVQNLSMRKKMISLVEKKFYEREHSTIERGGSNV